MNNTLVTYSFVSAEDLSDKVGYAVNLTGATGFNGQPKVELADNAEQVLGIITDGGRVSGDVVTVALAGIVEAVCGDTVTIGQLLKAENNGALVAATNTTDEQICAMALGAGADGETIKVLIRNMSV